MTQECGGCRFRSRKERNEISKSSNIVRNLLSPTQASRPHALTLIRRVRQTGQLIATWR